VDVSSSPKQRTSSLHPGPYPKHQLTKTDSVKLISGSLSRVNTGNQFGHASSIFTILFLAVTAVMQILCLNRGLRVYESTLVVPVFYGVYTATGFLNSLIFNNEVEAYKSWDLFLIFLSIIVLIGGVVLLTHKKPEPETTRIRGAATPRTGLPTAGYARRRESRRKGATPLAGDDEEAQLQTNGLDTPDGDRWALGEISDSDEGDDPDVDHHLNPSNRSPLKRRSSNTTAVAAAAGQVRPRSGTVTSAGRPDSERIGLMAQSDETDGGDDADMEDNSDIELAPVKGGGKSSKGKATKSGGKVGRRRSMDPFRDETDEASELELFGMEQGRSRPPVR
jgi:magnesium transporter